jgi:hypothetical protein
MSSPLRRYVKQKDKKVQKIFSRKQEKRSCVLSIPVLLFPRQPLHHMDNIDNLAIGSFTNVGIFLGWEHGRMKFQSVQGWFAVPPTPERIAFIQLITEELWLQKVKEYDERIAHYLDNLPRGAPY